VQSSPSALERYIAAIKLRRADLEQLGVTSAAITGSISRGDFDSGSDIDIVVYFDPSVVTTTFALARIKRKLETWLDRDVDIISGRALSRSTHRRILEDARVVF
jgi:predicted nucleotidyltransferase